MAEGAGEAEAVAEGEVEGEVTEAEDLSISSLLSLY